MKFVNLNGQILPSDKAVVPTDNAAFRYGYGLFETMLVSNGRIERDVYHWERLFSGMQVLQLQRPALMTETRMQEQVLRTVQKNKLEKLCRVRLQIFAGSGGIFELAEAAPGFLIECFSLQPEVVNLNENGLVLGLAQGVNKAVNDLSPIKSCNALIYAIAAAQAKNNKWNDALLANTSGNIIESTIANLFWIKNGAVYTPPLADGCIAGVMRRHVLSMVAVTEKSLSTEELLDADEVFLTNAIRRIKWAAAIDSRKFTKKQIEEIYQICFPNT